VACFVYNVVGLRIPQLTMQHRLNRIFGFNLVRSTLNNLKIKAADRYSFAKRKILERIVGGDLVHADETRANIKGHLAYVWVLTNMTEVAYVLAETRFSRSCVTTVYPGTTTTPSMRSRPSHACATSSPERHPERASTNI
jgi:hypothetical protein